LTADLLLLPDRMLEQVESWTAWDRRTWEPGSVLRLQELSEASRWVHAGVLSDGAINWLRSSLQSLIGQDHGLGQDAVKAQLSALLKRNCALGSQPQRQLEQLTAFASEKYLGQWADALAVGDGVTVERASRFVTSHVIDEGYHPESLRLAIKSCIAAGADASGLVEEFRMLVAASPMTFAGFVALTEVPEVDLLRQSDQWISQEETAARLRSSDPAGPFPRQVGGLTFEVSARDVRSATGVVSDALTRLESRTRLTRGRGSLGYHPTFYCDDGRRYQLEGSSPQLSVLSLVKTGTLYSAALGGVESSAVDDALLLASNLMHAPATVAAAGAWAALESLLTTGADNSRDLGRALAADRAAALAAAGWPRSELTRLSHRAEEDPSCPARLQHELADAGAENIERCQVMLNWLQAGKSIPVRRDRDRAAVDRMIELVANPRPVLGRVRKYMTCSLRRLYRQRNLVLHGGSVRPVALAASIRTAGPLVGAALDRVSHAYELHGVDPLDAVARAECALNAVGQPDGWPLHALAIA